MSDLKCGDEKKPDPCGEGGQKDMVNCDSTIEDIWDQAEIYTNVEFDDLVDRMRDHTIKETDIGYDSHQFVFPSGKTFKDIDWKAELTTQTVSRSGVVPTTTALMATTVAIPYEDIGSYDEDIHGPSVDYTELVDGPWFDQEGAPIVPVDFEVYFGATAYKSSGPYTLVLDTTSLHEICSQRSYVFDSAMRVEAKAKGKEDSPVPDWMRKSDCEYLFSSVLGNMPSKNFYKEDDEEANKFSAVWTRYNDQTDEDGKSCKFADQQYPKLTSDDRDDAVGNCQRQKAASKSTMDNIADITKTIAGVTETAINPFASVANRAIEGFFGSQAKAKNTINTNISVSMKPKTMIQQSNKCLNENQSVQTNTIAGTCQVTPDMFPGWTPAEFMEYTHIDVKDITQENVNAAAQTCILNASMQGLLDMDNSIDNQALQTALAQGENGGQADSENDICTSMSVEMSPCLYVNQQNCCSSLNTSKQINDFLLGCNTTAARVNQSNVNKSIQTCTTSSDTSITQDLANTIFNKSGQEATSKAKTDVMMLLLVALIPLIVIGGGVLLTGGSMYGMFSGGFGVIIVASVLIMCGGGLLIYYYTNKKTLPGKFLVDEPRSVCDGVDVVSSEKMNWEQAQKRFNESSTILAVDFFPDEKGWMTEPEEGEADPTVIALDAMDVNKLPGYWLGLAVFTNKVPGEECTYPYDVKAITRTKEQNISKSDAWMYSGYGLLGVGVLIGLYGLIYSVGSSSSSSSSIFPSETGNPLSSKKSEEFSSKE